MTPLAPLITRFLREYMPGQRGYSPETCDTYAISFKLLLEYAATTLGTRPSKLSIEQLDAPRSSTSWPISSASGETASPRATYAWPLSAFTHYLEHQVPSALAQISQIDAIPTKRHDQKLVRHLTMAEVRAILNAPDLTTRSGLRDRAMLHLCFAGGLRVSELVGACWLMSRSADASDDGRGKGRRERCLPLWKGPRMTCERGSASGDRRARRSCSSMPKARR